MVPWAESGTMISRQPRPRPRIHIGPNEQQAGELPWAPRRCSRGESAFPLVLAQLIHQLQGPWTVSLPLVGMQAREPGRLAASSLILGLYFIVQEPGIKPSTPWFGRKAVQWLHLQLSSGRARLLAKRHAKSSSRASSAHHLRHPIAGTAGALSSNNGTRAMTTPP